MDGSNACFWPLLQQMFYDGSMFVWHLCHRHFAKINRSLRLSEKLIKSPSDVVKYVYFRRFGHTAIVMDANAETVTLHNLHLFTKQHCNQ